MYKGIVVTNVMQLKYNIILDYRWKTFYEVICKCINMYTPVQLKSRFEKR